MKWKACVGLLAVVVASCGGRSVNERDDPSRAGGTGGTSLSGLGGSSGSGGRSMTAGSSSSIGGYGTAGTGGTSSGGVPPIAQGGASGGTSGVVIGQAGMSCQDLGAGCLSEPSDAACLSDADCTIASIPQCWDSALIGVNKQAKLNCGPAPACTPPPPGSPAYIATQDCSLLADPRQAAVRCAAGQCSTYYHGCRDCLY